MVKQERWKIIIDLCKKNEKVYSEDLKIACKTSIATVRRDLQQMEDLNLVQRFHGGVMLNPEANELPMLYRSNEQISEKTWIAKQAALQIKDNQTIYLDAGSSTYEMIPFIHSKNITVVTIGIPHLSLLMENNIRTIVLPGFVRKSTEAITGAQTLNQLDNFYFDCAFLGVNGIHEKAQITTTNEWEAAVKEKVIQQSNKAFILADQTKFNKICPIKYANLEDVICISTIKPFKMKYL